MKTISAILFTILVVQIVLADDVYLKDGSVFRNVRVVDTVGVNIRCLTTTSLSYQLILLSTVQRIDPTPFNPSQPTIFDDATRPLLRVHTFTGETYEGYFHSSDSISVTYSLNTRKVTLDRSNILSVEKVDWTTQSRTTAAAQQRGYLTVNEYPNLWLAIPSIAGGIWAYSNFKDASDLRDGIAVANALGLGGSTGNAVREASEKEGLGIAISVCSLALLIYAIIPEEVRVEQPLTINLNTKQLTLSLKL